MEKRTDGSTDLQNDRAETITVQVEVVDTEGLNYEFEEERLDSGVTRTFEAVVGTDERHLLTVSGDDWRSQLAWNVDPRLRFDGTVRVTVKVAGECVQPR